MKGYAHLLYVLVLCQVSTSLLAGVGESVFVGNPGYLLVPLLRGTLLVVAAGCAGAVGSDGRTRRRWPLVLLIVSAQVSVFGYVLSNLLGVLPWVSDTVNLVGLLTNLALPLAITWLAGQLLATWRRASPVQQPLQPVRYQPALVAPAVFAPALVAPAPPAGYRVPVVFPAGSADRSRRPVARTLVDPHAPVPGPQTALLPPEASSVWTVSPVSPGAPPPTPPAPTPLAAAPLAPTPPARAAVTRMLPRDGAR